MFNLNIHTDTANVQDVAEFWITKVHQGNVDALELRLFATILEKISKAILADDTVLDMALVEASQRKGEDTIKGHRFQIKETGTKYDFSMSDAWLFAKGKETEQAEIVKQVETMAKVIKTSAEITINGASLEVLPAIKISKTSIVFTLNK